MRTFGGLLGIVVALVGCGTPPSTDGIATSVGHDSAIENYDKEYAFTWPVKSSLYIDYALIDSTNFVAEYVVEVRRGHPLTLTYMIEPKDPHPLRVLVDVGASKTPILTLAASESELLVYGAQGTQSASHQSALLDETDYSAPIVDGGLPSVDASDSTNSGTAANGTSGGTNFEDLDDAIAALRDDVPNQKFESIPAMFENLRQSSYGGNVTGYDPDGAQILSWSGVDGTLEDAFTYMTYCLSTDGHGGILWECPQNSSK